MMPSVLIKVHGKEPLPIIDASEVQQVRKELIIIRDKVNAILNAIDGAPKSKESAMGGATKPTPSGGTVSTAFSTERDGKQRERLSTVFVLHCTISLYAAAMEPSKPKGSITMFDPLKPSASSQGRVIHYTLADSVKS